LPRSSPTARNRRHPRRSSRALRHRIDHLDANYTRSQVIVVRAKVRRVSREAAGSVRAAALLYSGAVQQSALPLATARPARGQAAYRMPTTRSLPRPSRRETSAYKEGGHFDGSAPQGVRCSQPISVARDGCCRCRSLVSGDSPSRPTEATLAGPRRCDSRNSPAARGSANPERQACRELRTTALGHRSWRPTQRAQL
jgi:hypothetical protein